METPTFSHNNCGNEPFLCSLLPQSDKFGSENEKKNNNIMETFAHGDSFLRRGTVLMNFLSGASFIITQLQEEATHP